MKRKQDIQIENHGSIFLFRVLTNHARTWVDKNVHVEEYLWIGSAFSVEHRYALDLAEGMRADGLEVA